MEPGALSGRTSLVTGPTGRIPPYTPEARARLADGLRQPLTRRADSHDDRGYSERCLRFVTGGPPMMAFPFAPLVQIFQTRDHVVFQNEEDHEIRIVHLDERPHVDPGITLWRGDSRGRWEGDNPRHRDDQLPRQGRVPGIRPGPAPHGTADAGGRRHHPVRLHGRRFPDLGRSRGARRCRCAYRRRRCTSTPVTKATTRCRSS